MCAWGFSLEDRVVTSAKVLVLSGGCRWIIIFARLGQCESYRINYFCFSKSMTSLCSSKNAWGRNYLRWLFCKKKEAHYQMTVEQLQKWLRDHQVPIFSHTRSHTQACTQGRTVTHTYAKASRHEHTHKSIDIDGWVVLVWPMLGAALYTYTYAYWT
jgi:bisphosphoglycerate-dependent phosphoglycerate mutase